MAALAVVVTTVGLSLCALVFGAHLALATERFLPTLPYTVSCKVMDPVITVLAWGCWLGAVFLSIWPPEDSWRGQAVFALVFAPLGCLARFYVSLYLNKLIPSFPVGTFAVNMFGTAILGMAWDLQHIPMGGIAGCQVLQGIEDGFCGCLTTVSTWVNELSTLKKGHAYKYGIASTLAGFSILLVIMGSVRWTHGFSELLCTH
jgi:fluoride ion exporter CrcB/FEX